MSAYLSVMVHNAWGPGVASSVLGIKDSLETKYFIYLYIDDQEPQKLRAAKQPYVIPIEAGAHTVAITRKPMGKIGAGDVANAAFGAALGGALSGGLGAVLGGHLGKKAVGEDGLKNAKVIEAHEGETFSCDVKADLRGMPKVTWM